VQAIDLGSGVEHVGQQVLGIESGQLGNRRLQGGFSFRLGGRGGGERRQGFHQWPLGAPFAQFRGQGAQLRAQLRHLSEVPGFELHGRQRGFTFELRPGIARFAGQIRALRQGGAGRRPVSFPPLDQTETPLEKPIVHCGRSVGSQLLEHGLGLGHMHLQHRQTTGAGDDGLEILGCGELPDQLQHLQRVGSCARKVPPAQLMEPAEQVQALTEFGDQASGLGFPAHRRDLRTQPGGSVHPDARMDQDAEQRDVHPDALVAGERGQMAAAQVREVLGFAESEHPQAVAASSDAGLHTQLVVASLGGVPGDGSGQRVVAVHEGHQGPGYSHMQQAAARSRDPLVGDLADQIVTEIVALVAAVIGRISFATPADGAQDPDPRHGVDDAEQVGQGDLGDFGQTVG
jgi:hypothetical protein